jgi:RNA polymerase sigma-70 factor (ECF subfamily)
MTRGAVHDPTTTAALARIHAQGAVTWAPVALSAETFAAHVATCLAAAPTSDVLAALEALHGTDLYLACAAGHAVPAAITAFVREFLQPIAGAVQAIDPSPAFVDEVRQTLHERLLLAADGPPRILQYGGRSALATWVGVAAQRTALGLLRTEKARGRAAERASTEPLEVDVDLDPELAYLKARYRDDFKAALAAAITQLPQRQRTVIRLHTVGGLKLAKIGALLGVDESTVSRWLQRARQSILADTHRELGHRLGIRVGDVPSLARLVTSQLDISLARLLGEEETRG